MARYWFKKKKDILNKPSLVRQAWNQRSLGGGRDGSIVKYKASLGEDSTQSELQVSLGNLARPCLKNKQLLEGFDTLLSGRKVCQAYIRSWVQFPGPPNKQTKPV